MAAPAVPLMQPVAPVVAPVGQCPGGPSLPIECDPKRPWPQCPPQSYCYATNSVDIGPYFCCPICEFPPSLPLYPILSGSTYGAAWRPATPFFNYVPPMPANWPEVMRMTANWPAAAVGLPVKARKQPATEEKEEDKIGASISGWMDRQTKAVSVTVYCLKINTVVFSKTGAWSPIVCTKCGLTYAASTVLR